MTSQEIRRRFLTFFEKRGHAIIPSASLVPENDPSVLFNTAGMQPLVPFLMGNRHPQGDKIANVQKCVRTTDIEDIGDKTHATFFEMLGNWSLGSYFKEDAIRWSYEFLTSKEEGLGLDPNRLYITVFGGDENAPRDEESAAIWQKVGMPKDRIFYKGVDSNWWPAVKGKDTWTGPTGPCSEMFYDVTGSVGDLSGVEEFNRADSEQKIVEIWNDVFMEYEKREGTIVGKLKQKNVDTGAGLERLTMVIQGVDNIFDTDLFVPILEKVRQLSKATGKSEGAERATRIIADHVRTSVFLIADGVLPSNTDRGYVLRRLIRRAVRFADVLGIEPGKIAEIIDAVPEVYGGVYKTVPAQMNPIKAVILDEEQKFRKTLKKGLEILNRKLEAQMGQKGQEYKPHNVRLVGSEHHKMWDFRPHKALITGKWLFDFFQNFGFPPEMILEELQKTGEFFFKVDYERLNAEFLEEMEKHRGVSRMGSAKFKGGLADTSEMSVRYHTATHLLNAALKKVLGAHVEQKGSNITPERLRFDFSHDKKMTDEEKKAVEDLVNQKIAENLEVSSEEMPLAKAREIGATGVFGEKYADVVKVYSIGTRADQKNSDQRGEFFSREICGGPHVQNTSEIGRFKISKEEAVSAGVRRIKAIVE